MTNKVIIYRDGKDLYITEHHLNGDEYEEIVNKAENVYDAIAEARQAQYYEEAAYIWLDKELATQEIDEEDFGMFIVEDGYVIELDKGGMLC